MPDNQAIHLNGVPPKTQIVHGIYSSRSTFLGTLRPTNIDSTHRKQNFLYRSIIGLVIFAGGSNSS